MANSEGGVRLRSASPPTEQSMAPTESSDVQLQPSAAVACSSQQVGPSTATGQDSSQAPSTFARVRAFLFQMLTWYVMANMIRSWMSGGSSGGQPGTVKGGQHMAPNMAANLFVNGTKFDMYVYLTSGEDSQLVNFDDSSSLIWTEMGLLYGDWTSGADNDGSRQITHHLVLDKHLQSNGSAFLHVFVVRGGASPDPRRRDGSFDADWTVHKSRQLNNYRKKVYQRTTNLITGESNMLTESEQARLDEGIDHEIVSHWHPNLTINVVVDHTAWALGQIPPPLDTHFEFVGPLRDRYKPVMFFNDYWNLNRDYQPLNETVQSVDLRLTFQPISFFKFQLYAAQLNKDKFNLMSMMKGSQSNDSNANYLASLLGNQDQEVDDQDALKEMLLETNVYLIAVTFIVSIVHSIFEFLAFKNDIQFWNNRRSLEGLSVRSVFFNVFQSGVVMLYVFDNETNFLIKVSTVVGLAIEVWKVAKVLTVSIDGTVNPISLFGGGVMLPRISIHERAGLKYEESGTKEYDRMAFKYLGTALFPLALCYAIYSVVYNEHKGWYSFVLSSIYGFLLTFGFIMMTPQLFINYKLKSVAHLPWRMMTYKALNTFIDDIFAFVIRMPTMYRLGCLRDDVVFFMFLYQRYIYRVDHSRVNEFGYSGEDLAKMNGKEQTPVSANSVVKAKNE